MRLGVPVTVSVIIALAAGLTATPGGAQELRVVCDTDHDGAVSANEAQGCAEQRFDLARGAADGLAEEQFAAALPDADGLRRQFAQVDEDGDGRISRDEWMRWFGPAYAETTKTMEGQPNGTD
jgi:Ca2+-binding EF-hand superfamily protein